MNQVLLGAFSGLVATVPMTVAMDAMHSLLPEEERYPLPPRETTMAAAEKTGVSEHLDERQRTALTLAAHFGYGALTGAIYGSLANNISGPPLLAGASFGLAVWAGSYLGLLPVTGLLPPATEHPARRNALMIAAHLVWGATLGSLFHASADAKHISAR